MIRSDTGGARRNKGGWVGAAQAMPALSRMVEAIRGRLVYELDKTYRIDFFVLGGGPCRAAASGPGWVHGLMSHEIS